MKPLYDTDFYSWLQEQARLLEQGQANQCDLDNLIEEVEDMGKRHLRKLDSHLTELPMFSRKASPARPGPVGRGYKRPAGGA